MAQDWDDDTYKSTHTAADDLQQIENNFACLKTCFSGSSAPTAQLEDGMLWYETDTHKLWLRANSSWMVLAHGSVGKVGNAATVDGYNASATPTANTLLPLDANGKYPASTLSAQTPTSVTLTDASGSWTVPTDVTKIWVTMCGGGGSGGTGARTYKHGGGGGSGYAIWREFMTVTAGESISFVCGAGGVDGNGGSTTFGQYRVDGGSKGGDACYYEDGCNYHGSGGAGSGNGGDAPEDGGDAYVGALRNTDCTGGSGNYGGGGGASIFGDGGDGMVDATGYGGGGGGGRGYFNGSDPGGDGAPGKIVIEYYT